MSIAEQDDKLAGARDQAMAQYESICEMVADLNADERKDEIESEINDLLACGGGDDWIAQDAEAKKLQAEWDRLDDLRDGQAIERINEDALSVEVRSDWYSPGDPDGKTPSEFCILLCTGGPAVRIRGELDQYCQPCRAWLECQDWGTPWAQVFDVEQDTLLAYARCFYFGDG